MRSAYKIRGLSREKIPTMIAKSRAIGPITVSGKIVQFVAEASAEGEAGLSISGMDIPKSGSVQMIELWYTERNSEYYIINLKCAD